MEFHHVGQDGLKLLTSGDLPTSASQSARITGVSHLTRPAALTYHKLFYGISHAPALIALFCCLNSFDLFEEDTIIILIL